MNAETIKNGANNLLGHWFERARRQPQHLDALIKSYLTFMATHIPETVVEGGKRIFGTMGKQYRQCAEEVSRLMELQR